MQLFNFFNSPVEGGKLCVQPIDLRLIIGSSYSPNPCARIFPSCLRHGSVVNGVYGWNGTKARLSSA